MLYLTLAGLSSVVLAADAVIPTNRAFSFSIPAERLPTDAPETLTFLCAVNGTETELAMSKREAGGTDQVYSTSNLFWVGGNPSHCTLKVPLPTLASKNGVQAPTVAEFLTTHPLVATDVRLDTAAVSPGSGARSNAVPSIVTDTLSILAEIAYEQAKSRAYDTVADGVRTQVCDRLELVKPLPIGWTSSKGKWEITLPTGKLLPGTCDELESHSDFISLVNAADKLAAALVGDIVDYGGVVTGSLIQATQNGSPIVRSAWVRGEILATLETVSQVLRDNAVDGTPPDVNDARQMLALFAERSWGETAPYSDTEKAAQAALKSVFVLSDACVRTEVVDGVSTTKVCSAREVVKKLSSVEAAQPAGAVRDMFHTLRPDVEALALDVIRLAATSDRGDTTAVVKASFSTAFDLVDLVFKVEAQGGTHEWSELGPLAELLSDTQAKIEPKVVRFDAEEKTRAEAKTALIQRSGELAKTLKDALDSAEKSAVNKETERSKRSTELEGKKDALTEAAKTAEKAEKAREEAKKAMEKATGDQEKKLGEALAKAQTENEEAQSKLKERTSEYEEATKALATAGAEEEHAKEELAVANSRVAWADQVQSDLAQLSARFDREVLPEEKDRVVHEMLALVHGPDKDIHTFILNILHPFRGVVLALAENDVGSALSDGCQLLLTLLENDQGRNPDDPENSARWLLTHALRRVVPVVGVLASNAHSLAQAEANPEDTEALRAARKDALEGLIKASTNRSGRDGDWVVSLGANVGFNVLGVEGGADRNADANAWNDVGFSVFGYDETHKEFSTSAVPIMLPMGLAIQHLPNPQVRQFRHPKKALLTGPLTVGKEEIGSYFGQPSERNFAFNGWHFQFSIIDLAQFLGPTATLADDHKQTALSDELQWSDFLMVGLQGGFAFGRAQDQLVVGVDLRCAPYSDNAFRASIFASYYVPFFDFN